MTTILASTPGGGDVLHFGGALLPLALMFFAALIFVAGAKKWNQSPVLAQLTAGITLATVLIILGNIFHIDLLPSIMENPFIDGFAQLGVIVLLLHIGMHSSVHDMKRVGGKAMAVALVGVVLPIIAGVGLALAFGIGDGNWTVILFLAAAMTATSVALSVSVLGELGLAKSEEEYRAPGPFDD